MAENTGLTQDMNPQMGGGPPPFMAGPINPMMTGAPPQAGGVLPPTNPVDATQPQAQDPMQQAMLQSLQVGTQGMQQREQTAMGPQLGGGGITNLIQQQQAQSGDLSTHPSFVHGQGAGGFFHNLGQALLALGLATRPGQAVDAAVHSKQRQEYAGRAEEIKDLQKQQQLTQEPEGALAGMGPKYMTAEARSRMADTAEENAQTRARRVADQASNDLVRQSQGWGRLGVAQQKQKFDEWYKGQMTSIARERIAAGMSENDARVAAAKDIAGSIQSNKLIQESPIKSQIMDWLGMAPDIQSPQGAATQTTKPGKQQPGAPSTPEASPAAKRGQSAAPARPANVPPNYIYKKNGPKGEGWYRPGSM